MTTSVTVALDGRTFTARLVQPTGVAPRAYPIVAFGHGFVQSRCQHQSTLAALAARGYIVIAPDSEGSFFPDHARFAADLTRAIRWVRATQPNAHATLDAVAGHSMGGGAALLPADADPAIESIATLAAAETRPSATSAAAGITAPALFVVGAQDRIVAPATTRAMYDAKPAPAVWASISGGYHCGFIDRSAFLGLGCDSGSISRSTQLLLTAQLLGDWLDSTLKGAAPQQIPAGVTVERR